jgi:hypothetical protein
MFQLEGMTASSFGKADSAGKEILKRLARQDPNYKRNRSVFTIAVDTLHADINITPGRTSAPSMQKEVAGEETNVPIATNCLHRTR